MVEAACVAQPIIAAAWTLPTFSAELNRYFRTLTRIRFFNLPCAPYYGPALVSNDQHILYSTTTGLEKEKN